MEHNKYNDFRDRFDQALNQLMAQTDNVPDGSRTAYEALQKQLEQRDHEITLQREEMRQLEGQLAKRDLDIQTQTTLRQQELAKIEAILSQLEPLIQE